MSQSEEAMDVADIGDNSVCNKIFFMVQIATSNVLFIILILLFKIVWDTFITFT